MTTKPKKQGSKTRFSKTYFCLALILGLITTATGYKVKAKPEPVKEPLTEIRGKEESNVGPLSQLIALQAEGDDNGSKATQMIENVDLVSNRDMVSADQMMGSLSGSHKMAAPPVDYVEDDLHHRGPPLPPMPGMMQPGHTEHRDSPEEIATKKKQFELNINKLKELMKVLEITTFLEGDIDPDDKVKLTTRIVDHQNGETTYLTPSFENIDGEFRYSQSLLQQDSDGKYVLSGSAKSDVEDDGSIGLHVQQFDLANEQSNKAMFRKYAAYLKMYIDYLYKYNLDLDSEHLKSLERNFVYYGSLANGKSPSLESNFQMTNLKYHGSRARKYETIGGSQGDQDSSVSYGLSNLNGKQDAHSFQNMVSTAAGEAPISGLQLKAHENQDYIRASAVGQAVAKPSDGVSMTTIDTVGQNGGFGFSDHVSFSEQEKATLATVSELNNLSVPSAKVDPQFKKMHEMYYEQRPKENERPQIDTRHLSEKMGKIGSHAKNEINKDYDATSPRTPNFVDADPLFPGILFIFCKSSLNIKKLGLASKLINYFFILKYHENKFFCKIWNWELRKKIFDS